MKFNIPCIADIHIGKKFVDELGVQLDKYFMEPVKELQDESNNIPLIMINGDYFDKVINFNSKAGVLAINFMNELVEWAESKDIKVRIIQGTRSHDFSQLEVFRTMEIKHLNFRIITRASTETMNFYGKKYEILYLPEEYPTDPEDYYNRFFNVEDDTYDFIFGHGMIDFVFNMKVPYSDETEVPMRNTVTHSAETLMRISKGPTVFGHIHDHQNHKDRIYYSGSFTRYDFATPSEKGWLLLEVNSDDTKDYELFMIENEEAPTFGIINIDQIPADSVEEKIEIVNTMSENYDFVRIKSYDKDNLSVVKQIIADDPKIDTQVVNKRKEENKIEEKYKFILDKETSLEGIIQQFIKVEYDTDIDIDTIEKIISEEEIDLEDF